MPALKNLPTFFSTSSATQETSVNFITISSILAFLGWRDLHLEIMQANESEQDLALTLKADYEQYAVSPNSSSLARLNDSLKTLIDILEKERTIASKRALEAKAQSSKPRTWMEKFKTMLGLDADSEVRYYEQLTEKYSIQLDMLLQFRDNLQEPQDKTIETNPHLSHQRQLLQTNPPISYSQFCYPSGTCSLSNGFPGSVFEGQVPNDNSGYSLSTGDFNGDGFFDLFVGAYQAAGSTGKSYVVFGNNDSNIYTSAKRNLGSIINGQQAFVLQGELANDLSGRSVNAFGDINGDGNSDLVIGAPGAGKTYVVFGNKTSFWNNGVLNISSLLDGNRGFALQGEATSNFFGYSVSLVGDVNGDGFSDIGVSAPPLAGPPNRGNVYVIFGNNNSSWGDGVLNVSSLMNGRLGFELQGELPADLFGLSIGPAGDINGDGIDDLTIGAQGAGGFAGKSYVVFGNNSNAWGSGVLIISSLMDGQRGFVLQGEAPNDLSGYFVGRAGDLNEDSLSDLMIGAPGAGKTYVVFGNNSNAWGSGVLNISSLMDGQRGFLLMGEGTSDGFGRFGSHGDFNGDGFDDLVIGASAYSSNTGKGYVVLSNRRVYNSTVNASSLMDGQRGFAFQGEDPSDFCFASIAAADFNGDGNLDLFVGAPGAQSSAGKSYVLAGGQSSIYVINNTLTTATGETTPLTSQNLALGSNRSNLNINSLPVTVTNVTNGYFAVQSKPSTPIANFFMQNISDGVIQFVHNGGSFPPSYCVLIPGPSSISEDTTVSYANINFLGIRPTLGNNQLNVYQGKIAGVGPNQLSASDPDDKANQLWFLISNIKYSQFIVNTSNTSQFTWQDVLNRNVEFQPDGSRNPPQYDVTACDPKSCTASQAAAITFNYEPELELDITPWIIDQGQGTPFSSKEMHATDAQMVAESITLELSNVTEGWVAYTNAPNTPINQFPQLSLITGLVQFTQNGSASTPTFSIRAFDGILSCPWQEPLIYLNHRPVQKGNIANQNVNQNQAFSFNWPIDLFVDPDNDTLTYTLTADGGGSLPVGLNYVPPRQLTGEFANPGVFKIEIKAMDPRGLSASTSFILSSIESSTFDYKTFFSTIASICGTLAGYAIYRILTARHRRGFPFANDMRKALNLEYNDFQRFEGNVFKSKMDDLLLKIEGEDKNFYANLTPAEQKSFAVCVANVINDRSLVSDSNCALGLYGLFCCLNVGWASELDLRAFVAQSAGIAQEAVDNWKTESGYKLRPMEEIHKHEKGTIYVEVGYTLSLMLITSSEPLDTSKLAKKPYLIIQDDHVIKDGQGKFQIWGCKGKDWQLTDLGNLDIARVWGCKGNKWLRTDLSNLKITPEQDETVFIPCKAVYCETLKKGHSLMGEELIHYSVYDAATQVGGNQGKIKAEQLEVKAIPTDIEGLMPYLPKIIKITTANGDAKKDKALTKWPYHSPTLKEKVKVFFRCSKPHTATFFSRPNSDLRTLKEVELAESREQKTRNKSSGLTLFEGENKINVRLGKIEEWKEEVNQRLISLGSGNSDKQ